MIQLSISFLLFGIAFLVIILLSLMLYLFVQRQRESRFEKVCDRYLQNYSQLWYDYLFNQELFSIVLVPRNRAQVEGVEMIFSSYLKNITNANVQQAIQQFANQYLKKFYEKDLSNKRWSIRMNALYHIADLQMDELLPACQELEKRNISAEEHFQLLKIYSYFHVDLFMEKLQASHINYSESEYRRLFVLLEEDVFIRFFDDFNSWSAAIQFAVIDTSAVKRNMQYIDQLKMLLNHDVAEIKIRALKGLYEIGIIDEIDTYLPFVTSDMWEARLMVAKIFKHVPLTYTYRYLEQLLQDENWWVRSQAAKTISEDRQGLTKLQQFIETSNDQYAIEIAQEIIARKEGSV
ncbi:HEAT repeat domain-containing protein [Lysinibacillus sp. NPDC098008]|uniref:HEAT repeat domain-containing protein n=1 Tax=Lysinibacillus sp. NPDC098008 TaxID=3364146 RepID=UPI0037F159DA